MTSSSSITTIRPSFTAVMPPHPWRAATLAAVIDES
jgi:hypothetical protein